MSFPKRLLDSQAGVRCVGWGGTEAPWRGSGAPGHVAEGDWRASGSRSLSTTETARSPRYKIWTFRPSPSESKLLLHNSSCLPWHTVQTRRLRGPGQGTARWATSEDPQRPAGLNLCAHAVYRLPEQPGKQTPGQVCLRPSPWPLDVSLPRRSAIQGSIPPAAESRAHSRGWPLPPPHCCPHSGAQARPGPAEAGASWGRRARMALSASSQQRHQMLVRDGRGRCRAQTGTPSLGSGSNARDGGEMTSRV